MFAEAEGPRDITLDNILVFFSGTDKVPPLGFTPDPALAFNSDAWYPTASTCSLTLFLPTRYNDYQTFKSRLTVAFKDHGGFGII